jgi:hypothetical protein
MPAKHMLNFTYEDNSKIKSKHVAGISRTFHLSMETLSRPPQSCETIPLISVLRNTSRIIFVEPEQQRYAAPAHLTFDVQHK